MAEGGPGVALRPQAATWRKVATRTERSATDVRWLALPFGEKKRRALRPTGTGEAPRHRVDAPEPARLPGAFQKFPRAGAGARSGGISSRTWPRGRSRRRTPCSTGSQMARS